MGLEAEGETRAAWNDPKISLPDRNEEAGMRSKRLLLSVERYGERYVCIGTMELWRSKWCWLAESRGDDEYFLPDAAVRYWAELPEPR